MLSLAMENKKLYLNLGIGLLVTLLLLFLATKVVPSVLVTLTKAAPASKVSVGNSYILGGKTLAQADGKDKCIVNVFVLDKDSKGVKGIAVSLLGAPEGEVESVSGVDGKTTFELSSKMEGQFPVSAVIAGTPMAGGVKLTFRNE